MKRKFKILLTFVFLVILLSACGRSTETEFIDSTTDAKEQDKYLSEEELNFENSISNIKILSEYLNMEKVICYQVDAMDKAETPSYVYFFENGTLTIIPGHQFDLTLGNFSQMKDEEIWEKYENVRPTYEDWYCSQKEPILKYRIDSISETLKPLQEEEKKLQTLIDDMQKETVNVDYLVKTGLTSEGEVMGAVDHAAFAEYITVEEWEKCYEDGIIPELVYKECLIKFEDELAELQKYITDLEEQQNKYTYKGPFFELPFSIVAETDATGNYTQTERIVYPTLEDDILGDIPRRYYDSIDINASIEGQNIQIYDTNYMYFVLNNGELFCTTASVTIDTIDSPNVLIDVSSDALNELFEEEVTARYK